MPSTRMTLGVRRIMGIAVSSIDGPGERRVRGDVGDENKSCSVVAALLANRLDAHLLVRECLRHGGQHAGPVSNVQRRRGNGS